MKPDTRRPDAIIARHFPTALNEHKVSRAWLPVGIDKEAAKKLAPAIAKIFDQYKIDTILCSNLPRGEQSAEIIGEYMKAEPEIESTADLRTWNTGDMGGKKESETVPKRMKLIKYPDIEAPGGESFQDFLDRYEPELQDIVDRRKAGEEIAFIAHGHHLLCTPHILQDEEVDPKNLEGLDEDFKPGGVWAFFIQPDGSVKIDCLSGDCDEEEDDV